MSTKLKLDIDTKEPDALMHFIYSVSVLRNYYHFDKEKVSVRETRKGYHVRLTVMEDLKDEEVLLLQLLLLSDPTRELFNFIRYKNTGHMDNVLFYRKLDSCGWSQEVVTTASVELETLIIDALS